MDLYYPSPLVYQQFTKYIKNSFSGILKVKVRVTVSRVQATVKGKVKGKVKVKIKIQVTNSWKEKEKSQRLDTG